VGPINFVGVRLVDLVQHLVDQQLAEITAGAGRRDDRGGKRAREVEPIRLTVHKRIPQPESALHPGRLVHPAIGPPSASWGDQCV